MDTITLNLQYKKAMPEYQHNKEAEIIRYNSCPDFDIPPSVRCCEKTPVNTTTIINDPKIYVSNQESTTVTEEVIEVNIDPVEKMEIERSTTILQAISGLTTATTSARRRCGSINCVIHYRTEYT